MPILDALEMRRVRKITRLNKKVKKLTLSLQNIISISHSYKTSSKKEVLSLILEEANKGLE